MAKIHEGDELLLPVKIKNGDAYVTPSNCDDVRIQVGNILKSYVKQEIEYSDNTWYFPLTEEDTRAAKSEITDVQVAIKVGSTITHSDVQQIVIAKSIIRREW